MSPSLLFAAFWIAVAPAAGSFVGLVADRYGSGRSVVVGGSRCDGCGRRLGALELIPLLSWLWLRLAAQGRSRCCGARLRPSLFGVELAALVLAVWAAAATSGVELAASVALGWTLLGLSLVDLRHFRLPDAGTLPLILAGLGLSLAGVTGAPEIHALGAALGFGLLAGLAAAYRAWRGVEGLGLGDAKLLAAAGAWLGPLGVSSTLLWASLFGLASVAILAALRGNVGWRTAIPFGPALALGFWITWLHGPLTLSLG